MKLNLFIVLRYLKKKNKFFFSFSHNLSLLGIIIGVFSLIMVSSFMNALREDLEKQIIGSKAEIRIVKKDFSYFFCSDTLKEILSKNKDVKAFSPILKLDAVLQKKSYIYPTFCNAVDISLHKKVSDLQDYIVLGKSENLSQGIILGIDLAMNLDVSVGDELMLIYPQKKVFTPLGLFPKSKMLKVVAIFESYMVDFDNNYSYIADDNSYFFTDQKNAINQIEIKTYDFNKSIFVARQLQKKLGDEYLVQDWSELEKSLFMSLKIEKIALMVILSLMIVLSSFNMGENFVRLVIEKKKEIAILKSIGFSDKKIISIFLIVGFVLSLLGIFIGLLLSVLFIFLQLRFHLIKLPISGIKFDYLPLSVDYGDFFIYPLLVIIICYICISLPAYATKNINIVKDLRE